MAGSVVAGSMAVQAAAGSMVAGSMAAADQLGVLGAAVASEVGVTVC